MAPIQNLKFGHYGAKTCGAGTFQLGVLRGHELVALIIVYCIATSLVYELPVASSTGTVVCLFLNCVL
jgi:hypothetical protein